MTPEAAILIQCDALRREGEENGVKTTASPFRDPEQDQPGVCVQFYSEALEEWCQLVAVLSLKREHVWLDQMTREEMIGEAQIHAKVVYLEFLENQTKRVEGKDEQ